MPRVGEDCAVLHGIEVLAVQHVHVTGHRDEDVSLARRVVHRHHAEAIHRRLERLHRVDLCDDDVGAVALRPGRQPAANPAVAGDDKGLARQQHVGRPDDPVNRRLTGAVAVVKHVLGVGLVHGDDRIGEDVVLRHRAQTDHASRRLLGTADHLRQLVAPRLMQDRNEVGAVVHRHLRPVVERGFYVLVVRIVVLASDRIRLDRVMRSKRCRDGVVGRERIGRAQRDVRAACLQRQHQVCSLARDVKTRREAQALQRLLGGEPLADQA